MKINSLRNAAAMAIATITLAVATAETYTTNAGVSHDGRIYKVLEDVVSLRVGEERISIPVADFDGAAQSAIEAWKSANPEKVDVYTKWDVQPAIKSSSMPSLPKQFKDPNFKGMVSVDLVLSKAGRVIFAKVKKSTHPELEAPSVEAAKTWVFAPARVGGKAVKSKLRVPFRFKFDAKRG